MPGGSSAKFEITREYSRAKLLIIWRTSGFWIGQEDSWRKQLGIPSLGSEPIPNVKTFNFLMIPCKILKRWGRITENKRFNWRSKFRIVVIGAPTTLVVVYKPLVKPDPPIQKKDEVSFRHSGYSTVPPLARQAGRPTFLYCSIKCQDTRARRGQRIMCDL